MKKWLIATTAMLGVAGPAFAQGLPQGMTSPDYASHAFSNPPYEHGSVFSSIFGHAKGDHARGHTADDTTTQDRGI